MSRQVSHPTPNTEHVTVPAANGGTTRYEYRLDCLGPKVCTGITEQTADGRATSYEYAPGLFSDKGARK